MKWTLVALLSLTIVLPAVLLGRVCGQDVMTFGGMPQPTAPSWTVLMGGPEVPPPVSPSIAEELSARLARLEAENRRMASELHWLREHPVQLPAAPRDVSVGAGIPVLPAGMARTTEAPQATAGVGLPEVRDEVKKLMWTKGDFKVVPYGWLWGNSVYATERTNPGTYTLFVESATRQGEDEFIVDGRNTRLGIDISGPQISFLNCTQSGGKVEIDFQGTPAVTENKGGVLLRHAYAEVKNEDFRLLAGQTWDVISPLNPGMLMYSVGWDGGNIGYRRAQFRAERFLAFSDTTLLTLQSSINQNVFPDVIAKPLGNSTYVIRGEPMAWPILEGRAAMTFGERVGPDALPITLGFSGHGGQTEFDVTNSSGVYVLNNARRNTWSFNTDLRVPLTQRFGVQTEFFLGENLSQFLGGIGQGIEPTTLRTIHSIGGWVETWYDWTERFHTHFGYSLDDPDNSELVTTGDRTFNQFYYGNFIYDVTKQFIVGLEVSSWKTLYVNQAPGESVRCEFVVKYGF